MVGNSLPKNSRPGSSRPGNSRSVTSNQEGVHPDIIDLLKRYQDSEYQRPIAHHTLRGFEGIEKIVASANRPILLDSACGVGESSVQLSKQYPDHLIIGLDQSEHRLQKNPYYYQGQLHENLLLVQADCVDFWRLALRANWDITRHYILYPNPWPKKQHLKRRWHGHPVFWMLSDLCPDVQLRSNWKLYLDEFAMAWEYAYGVSAQSYEMNVTNPLTPFERKYLESGQALYRLDLNT